MVQTIALQVLDTNLTVHLGSQEIGRELVHFAYIPTVDNTPYPIYASELSLEDALWDLVTGSFGERKDDAWRAIEAQLGLDLPPIEDIDLDAFQEVEGL